MVGKFGKKEETPEEGELITAKCFIIRIRI